ncbi:MAG: hypothetical protein N2712_04775 [Brevinematales bacterium]|nr:hypothetical protein [Brevinematales bacterium]
MEINPDLVKENLELLLRETLSLFMYQVPKIEVGLVSSSDSNCGRTLANYGKSYFHEIPKYKDLILKVAVYYGKTEIYSLPKEIPSFFDFLMIQIVRKFVDSIGHFNNFVFSDKEEMIRNISKEYISTLFRWLGYKSFPFQKIFFLFNSLSSETYEGKKINSNIVFIPEKIGLDIEFSSKTELDRQNFRIIRKILQIGHNQNLLVVAYEDKIVGLSKPENIKSTKSILIHIVDNFWEVLIRDGFMKKEKLPKDLVMKIKETTFLSMIKFRNGFPELHKSSLNRQRLRSAIKQTFKDLEENKIKKLIKLISDVSKLPHGLIMIITTREVAKSEVNRLSNRIFKIEPFSLFNEKDDVKSDIISSITSIDGAIIIDTDGLCYGMGIILDGDVSIAEKPSRGSRYNSSIRYIDSRNRDAIAVVLSEDGMLDIITAEDIKSSGVEEMIETLISESENIIVL